MFRKSKVSFSTNQTRRAGDNTKENFRRNFQLVAKSNGSDGSSKYQDESNRTCSLLSLFNMCSILYSETSQVFQKNKRSQYERDSFCEYSLQTGIHHQLNIHRTMSTICHRKLQYEATFPANRQTGSRALDLASATSN